MGFKIIGALLAVLLLAGCAGAPPALRTPSPLPPSERPLSLLSPLPPTNPPPFPTAAVCAPLPLETQPPAEGSLRIGTFNIAAGRFCLTEKLGDAILRARVDIIGLQEVDVGAARSYRIHQPAFLSLYADLPYYVFAPAIGTGIRGYGVAVLSRYPILENDRRLLPGLAALPDTEQRVVCYCKIALPGGEILHLFNTHLPYESPEAIALGYRGLRDYIREKTAGEDYILLGDMNSEADITLRQFPELTCINTRWDTVNYKIIDNIFASSGWRMFGLNVYETKTKFAVSDHQLVVCRISKEEK